MTESQRKEFEMHLNELENITRDTRNAFYRLQREFEQMEIELECFKADFLDIESEDETEESCSVYYILNREQKIVKIGVSSNVKYRLSTLQTANGSCLELLHEIEFSSRKDAMEAERALHNHFSYWRKKPAKIHKTSEWFDYKIVPSLLNDFREKEDIENLIFHERQKRKEVAENIEGMLRND